MGGIDDWRKLRYGSSKGLSAAVKYGAQSLIALSVAVLLYATARYPAETELIVPFFKEIVIPLGIWFVPFVYFVVVGSSNAVNLTDGLDEYADVVEGSTVVCQLSGRNVSADDLAGLVDGI